MGRVRWLDICDQGRSAFRIPYLFCLSSLICPTPTITHSRHQSQIFFSPQHKQPAPANRHSPAILNHRNCNNARRHSEDSPTPNLIWTMKLELSTLILRVCVVSSLATLTWAHRRGHCSELTGIVSGGGSGQLDLDILNTTFQAEPFDFLDDPENPIVPTVAACSSKLETPISMRNLLAIDTAVFSASNMFRPGNVALDIFGDKHTSKARRKCQPDDDDEQALFDLHLRVAVIYALIYGSLLGTPSCRELVEPMAINKGLDLTLVLDGAEPSIETPWGLAKTYVDEIHAWLTENDGWNADGSANREFNRVPFSDYEITDSEGNSWTPYVPRNTPWKFSKKKRWQPLMESDGLGFIWAQEHVTPHIGATGRFFGFYSAEDEQEYASRELDKPNYDYKEASYIVLEETRLTAEDPFRQSAISTFDNKFASLVPIKILYFLREADSLTPLDFYRATVEVQIALYNGIILAWKEKIRQDRPRPPSVIKSKLGDEEVETYAGPGQGVQLIKASEWEPFIRTMPHTEFPSASACICKVYAEQIAHFLGEDEIDPPLIVDPPLFNETVEFKSWTDISDTCGFSRLWGGMHFAEAIPAGAELCGGGEMAESISSTIGALIEGDESAAVFKKNPGELMVRSFL